MTAPASTIKSMRNGVLTIEDGSSPVKSFSPTFDNEFKLEIAGTPMTFLEDRGSLPDNPEAIPGVDSPMKFSFVAKVGKLTDSATAALMDLINALQGGSGSVIASSWVSTVTGSFKILVTVKYSNGAQTYSLQHCSLTGNFAEAVDGNTITIAGVCPHAYPTITVP